MILIERMPALRMAVILPIFMRRALTLTLMLTLMLAAAFTWLAPQAAAQTLPLDVPQQRVQTLSKLIVERISLMRDVAQWKWIQGAPIEDLEREKRVLTQMRTLAKQRGMDPDAIAHFTQLQMNMSKAVQHYWHRRWKRNGFEPSAKARSLTKELRPLIIQLGIAQIDALYLALSYLQEAGEAATDDSADPTPIVRYRELARPDLGDLAKYFVPVSLIYETEDALERLRWMPVEEQEISERIERSKYLRLGLSGDYPPFSQIVDAKGKRRISGLDVELAKSLARSFRSKLIIVPTSWETLSADLKANRFDLAMGGITITEERSRVGTFSDPYFRGGKQGIARCEDIRNMRSVRRVNQEGIRVIVNPGGTNEAWAREHLTQVELIIHNDNLTIFDEIIAGRADIMVTDNIEVQLQVAEHANVLCQTFPRFVTRSRKGIFMPKKDEQLMQSVNIWLERLKRSGELSRVFEAHAVEPQW